MNASIEKLPRSRVRLTVTVPAETLTKYYELAVKKVAAHVEIKGFRKGHAPEPLVIQRAGNQAILNEMLDLLLPESYFQAIKSQPDLTPVCRPTVDVKSLKGMAENNGIPTELIFTAEVDVMPEVVLGEYKKIRVKPKTANATVDPKEIEKTVTEIKKVYGAEYLKVGNFKDEAVMREAIEESIKKQDILQAKADTYDLIIDELLKKAKVEAPETFVRSEIHRMERQVETQAKAYGLTFEDWLKQEKKTHEDIHKEWEPQAKKAAIVGMILGQIAELEGIDPTRNDASRLVLEKLHDYATGE